MEIVIAAFAGIGSVIVGILALRLQHLADTRSLVWPEIVRTKEDEVSESYFVQVRAVQGPIVDANIAMAFDDQSHGVSSLPLLETGECWDVWPVDSVREAQELGKAKPRVLSAIVVAPSRSSKYRWHSWIVESTDEGPDRRKESSYWSRATPSILNAAKRAGMQLEGTPVQLKARKYR